MTKHTAIPWHVEYHDLDNCSGIPLILGGQNGTEPVCEILGPLDDEDGPHRGHYDLALLLAAPDLLAACEIMAKKVDQYLARGGSLTESEKAAVEHLRDAIARAKGDTNG